LALPVACIVLALAAIPLGISSRRRGKSAAVVLTVGVAFVYYMGLITVTGMARQGSIPVSLAVWIPNIVFALGGLLLISRLETMGVRDYVGAVTGAVERMFRWRKPAPPGTLASPRVRKSRRSAFFFLPQIMDGYLIGSFLFYFFLSLATFVLMTHMYTFFELLSDIIKNRIPLERVWTYLFYVTPRFVYEMTPVSVLTSVLVVFGVLTKNNEVTAFKACGVSVYRLTMPILLVSLLLSGGMFAFDHYVVPQADRRQDAIRAEIKGRPPQTFLNPDRKWIYGTEDRVFYYRAYDPVQNLMLDVNVFEIDPATFRLKRHIKAGLARWEPAVAAWVFQNGWSRDINGTQFGSLINFTNQTHVFPEIVEKPDYFVKEAVQSQQMNYQELRAYIEELKQREFDTITFQVQFYKKFSVPLFAFVLAMVSVPFAFQAGNRGAMAGVGISIAIFIAYKAIGLLFEQLGNLNQLPPVWAAWSPDAVFFLFGGYFLARVRS
jgi:LPS export ABC transporter permease LptG